MVTDDDDKLVGILTPKDVAYRVIAPGLDIDRTLVLDVATPDPDVSFFLNYFNTSHTGHNGGQGSVGSAAQTTRWELPAPARDRRWARSWRRGRDGRGVLYDGWPKQ